MHVVGALGLGGGAAPAAVTAPSPTTESVAAGGTPAGKTFSAFTDPDSRIASYSATTTNSVGSAVWTGTGLGAYTIGSSADGDSGTLALTALDSSGDPLATAYHSWNIAAAAGAPTFTADATVDWTTDVTVGSLSGAGSAVIYAGDGTTPRVTITNTSSGAGGTWGASWGTSAGVVFEGPSSGSGMHAWPLTVPGGVNQNKDYICLNVRLKLIAVDNGASIGVGIGTTVSALSGRWAGMRIDPGAINYTQATRAYNGGTANGSNQNAVAHATYVYVTCQIRFANGRTPTMAWRVDAAAPAFPTTMVEVDGATWFGEDVGSWATSAATAMIGAFPSTIYLSSFIATGTATQIGLEAHQFLTMDAP
jgi:hypothetical protein